MISDRCHKTCFAAWAAAIYSASGVDGATVDCFFELHATASPAMVTTYPLMDFLSKSDAQSASQYKFIPSLSSSGDPPYTSSEYLVPLRYRNNRLIAVQC